MAEVTIKRQKASTHEFGISMPKRTIDRINAVKGPYISRSKFILRAVDKALKEEEEERKKLHDAHSSVGSPEERQAAVATTKPRTRGGGSRSNG
jgi:metal-responsive CopG/Arc/MetJ family transcriptional regulator